MAKKVTPKKGSIWDRLFGKLYNLQDREGNYYANDPLRKKQYENYIGKSKKWKAYSDLDDAGKADFLKQNNFETEDDFQDSILNKHYSKLDAAAEAERAGLAGGVGGWTDEANRGTTKQIMKDWVMDHKLKTLGYGAGGLVNLAGLTDNDKFGGQIGGAALGAGLGSLGFLPGGIGAVPAAMFGGAIGSLFDKLRAKREQEAQYPQYYGR